LRRVSDKLKFVGHEFSISSIWQHPLDPFLITVRNQRIDIQKPFPFVGLLRQDVARMRVPALNFARSRQAKTFRRASMCF